MYCIIIYRSLSFRVQIGATSSGSTCEPADSGEDVVLEYQAEGASAFVSLKTLGYDRKMADYSCLHETCFTCNL